ncbi:MAG TPA: lysophospholipid acyltransferase family protein, partial [Vicinamibacteria bacterium]|nr:lysophospholipid acyltransferase family protein [Vicinamibacteria bacterium]
MPLRTALALPLIVFYTVWLGVPAVVCGLLGQERAVRSITALWGRAILRAFGVEVKVAGAEHCPSRAAVYAANHASALDIPILFGHLPVDFKVIHKRSLYAVPMIGLYLYATGNVPIERGSGFRARKSLEEAVARVRSGANLLVFPEGTRSEEDAVGPFKRGSFVLAIEAGAPVVPLSLVGIKQVASGGLRVRGGVVHLVVHPSVPTAGRDPAQAGELAEEVRRIVASV